MKEKQQQQEASRFLTVPEYAQYMSIAPGTVYNMVGEFCRSGSTDGLYIKPLRVGARRRGIRFDRKRLDAVLDRLR